MSKQNCVRFVLMHGWGGSRDSLVSLSELISGKLSTADSALQVYTDLLEAPGFGQTELDRVYKFSDYCEYFKQRISTLAAETPDCQLVLIGHSFGGKILLQLAADNIFPDARFVIINSSGLKPRNSRKKKIFKAASVAYKPLKLTLNRLGLSGMQKFARKAIYKYVVRARDYEKIQDTVLLETFKNVIDYNLSESALAEIKSPTLLIWGEKDTATPLWMGQRLHELIGGSELVTVPDATHGLPLRQPEKCADIITEWLR